MTWESQKQMTKSIQKELFNILNKCQAKTYETMFQLHTYSNSLNMKIGYKSDLSKWSGFIKGQ